MIDTKFHLDGYITFWSVYFQQWVRSNDPSDREWAAITSEERSMWEEHFRKHSNMEDYNNG